MFAIKWKLVEVENGKRSGKEIPDRLQTLTGERIEVSLSIQRETFLDLFDQELESLTCYDAFLLKNYV